MKTIGTLSASSQKSARRAASKHACGVVIEVSIEGIHRSSKTVAKEWRWREQRRCFTRVAA